mmetsp:Transcript_21512/g.21866  ORF Transcript_21512/g.21866 Transcript_21512/m.21866 type:complete len:84 (+) Transcript_21512:122-373(+)
MVMFLLTLSSLVTVLLLTICTCTYLREMRPTIFANPLTEQNPVDKHDGLKGVLWKLSRIGERLSPYVGGSCALMAFHILFLKK